MFSCPLLRVLSTALLPSENGSTAALLPPGYHRIPFQEQESWELGAIGHAHMQSG
jgi:hypothetical protein